jgi:hypothetical protein
MHLAEKRLPEDVIVRATLRGNEYAWRVGDIPTVIEAAKSANLINVGGQLQFRIPEGGTCECCWVEVDTYKEVSADLLWADRVSATAASALSQFRRLCTDCDFVAEGRTSFGEHLREFEAQGGDLNEALCFVWFVEGQKEAAARQR